MSITKYFILLGLCTGLCWAALFAVVFLMNPNEAGWLAFLLFYISIGLASLGTAAIFLFFIKSKTSKDELPHKLLKASSRQAVVIALLIVIVLILQSFRWLAWWNLLTLLAVAGVIETILLAKRD
jgi:hypothetical protein